MTTLRSTALPAFALTGVCAVVCGLTAGIEGVAGALVGGALVIVLNAMNPMALGPVAKLMPQASVGAALLWFMTKMVVVLAVFITVLTPQGRDGWVHAPSLAATVLVVTVAWTILLVRSFTRTRQPYYDLNGGA